MNSIVKIIKDFLTYEKLGYKDFYDVAYDYSHLK